MKKKKSLQKFTEIDNLKTVKETKDYLIKYPDSKNELWVSLTKRISESYLKDLGKEFLLTNMLIATIDDDEIKKDIRNSTYETNHSIITSSIHNYILENRCFPTMSRIQEDTNLSRQTICNHLNSGLKSEHNKLIQGKNEIMALNALSKLYLIGVQDKNPTALKHFIQLSGAVSKGNTTNVNNCIQINNLKLSKEDFNKLPKEDILEIEGIISKTLSNS